MTTDWLIRVGDGINLKTASRYKIWHVDSKNNKNFINQVQRGDRLWFITNNSNGLIIAFATFISYNTRQNGSLTDEQIGYINEKNKVWDIEIHYTNYYPMEHLKLLTFIKGICVIRKYANNNCRIDLPEQYNLINKYYLSIVNLNNN